MENEIEISARAEAFYVVTRRWLSDLEFFKIEASFLHRLQQDYFIRSADQPTIEKLKAIGQQLAKLYADMESAVRHLDTQINSIDMIVENKIPEDVKVLSVTQLALGHSMTQLIDEYRRVKKQLFELVENIMRATKR
jgi:REP element-mobilizing transposase RayT